MIIEHAIFFLLGYVSMIISEMVTKYFNLKTKTRVNGRDNIFQTVVRFSTKHWTNFLRRVFFKLNKKSLYLSIPVFAIIMVWHVPGIFNLSLLYQDVHIFQHLSFIIVGILVYLSTRFGFESYSIFYMLSSMGVMILSGIVLSITDSNIYEFYSLESHHRAGEYMFYFTLILGLVVFPYYLISRTLFHIGKSNKNNDMI